VFSYWTIINTLTAKKTNVQYNYAKYIMEGLGYRHCLHNIEDASDSWSESKFEEVKDILRLNNESLKNCVTFFIKSFLIIKYN